MNARPGITLVGGVAIAFEQDLLSVGMTETRASTRSPECFGLRSPESRRQGLDRRVGVEADAKVVDRLRVEIWRGASSRYRWIIPTSTPPRLATHAGVFTISRAKIVIALPGLPSAIAADARSRPVQPASPTKGRSQEPKRTERARIAAVTTAAPVAACQVGESGVCWVGWSAVIGRW